MMIVGVLEGQNCTHLVVGLQCVSALVYSMGELGSCSEESISEGKCVPWCHYCFMCFYCILVIW